MSKWKRPRNILGITIGFVILLIILSFRKNSENAKNTPLQVHERRQEPDRDFIDYAIHDGFAVHQFDRVKTNTESSYQSTRGEVKIFRGPSLKKRICVPFKTLRGTTPICIFDPKKDKMISSYINDYGTWEPAFLNATIEIMKSDPNMTFLDLGCNIGAYSIFNAKMGRKVIAVDIVEESLLHLQESLLIGKIYENVTLVHNAISDTRHAVSVEVVDGNIGGSHIIDSKMENDGGRKQVQSILLDDLLQVIPSGSVLMKMDIEGTELKAFRGSRRFFQTLDVKVILMEWMLHRNHKSGLEIIRILLRSGMMPYIDHKQGTPLNLGSYSSWPDNVFWIKR